MLCPVILLNNRYTKQAYYYVYIYYSINYHGKWEIGFDFYLPALNFDNQVVKLDVSYKSK